MSLTIRPRQTELTLSQDGIAECQGRPVYAGLLQLVAPGARLISLALPIFSGFSRDTENRVKPCSGRVVLLARPHARTPHDLFRLHLRRNNAPAKQNKEEQRRGIGASSDGTCATAGASWQLVSCAVTMPHVTRMGMIVNRFLNVAAWWGNREIWWGNRGAIARIEAGLSHVVFLLSAIWDRGVKCFPSVSRIHCIQVSLLIPGTSAKSLERSAKSCQCATCRWSCRGIPWSCRGTAVVLGAHFNHIFPLDLSIFILDFSLIPGWCHETVGGYHERHALHTRHIVFKNSAQNGACSSIVTSGYVSLHSDTCLCGLVSVTRCQWLGARPSNTSPSTFTKYLLEWLVMRFQNAKGNLPMLNLVNVGIDTIIVNVKTLDEQGKPAKVQAFPGWLEERLQEWQEVAREDGKPQVTAMTFNDARLLMLPNGASVWKYIVKNDCLQLQMVPRLNIPALARVTFSSPYLWSCSSPQDAVDEVHAFCLDIFGHEIMLQAAQVDMCVDVTGLRIPLDWQKVFVSRARVKKPIGPSQKDLQVYHGPKLETLQFSGHGQPVSCKVYDKIAEIKQHSPDKVWFFDIWKRGGWNGNDPVWRVEFSEERECLHEQKIEDIYDALRNLKRMWAYCSQEWLRMVTPAKTPNRARWDTSPAWKQVQRAFDTYGDKMVDALGPLVREAKREVNIERGVAALAGYATTLAAWLPIDESEIDPNELMEIVKDFVQERWCQRGTSLPDVIREKKFLYSQKG